MFIDAHRHFTIDVSSVQELLDEIEADDLGKTVLFGYNGMKFGGCEHIQDKKVLEVFNAAPYKIIPFLCDFDFDDEHIEKYLVENLNKGFFKGIGEILVGHAIIKNKFFKNINYYDKKVLKVFEIASDFDVPVIVHVDTPFTGDFCQALRECKKSQFIWAHTAYDFTQPFGGNENNPNIIEMLLNCYENLSFDISMWKISPIYFMDDKWLTLLEKYDDRFLFGTDMTDNYKNQSIWIRAYELVFKQLSRKTVQKITEDNILRLCNCEKVK